MNRITETDIKTYEDRLNKMLKRKGYTIDINSRYGYKAFDLYQDGRLVETIRSGLTGREAYEALLIAGRLLEL